MKHHPPFVRYVLFAAALLLCTFFLFASQASEKAKWPVSPGGDVKKNGSLKVDVAGVSQGYFQAALQEGSKSKFKLRVARNGQTLTYNLNSDGNFEVFPLQLGNGSYEITLYKNVSGKKYTSAGKVSVRVELKDAQSCFLYPNQYVSYTPESEAVLQSDELCGGMTEKEAYDAVCSYMSKTFLYDYVKAVTVKSGTLPDVDGTYGKKMGICQDLSAVMCCMLRTQGIPARLTIGYADSSYHAWVQVRFGGQDYFFDPTLAVNGIGKVKTYSVERYY